MVGRSIDGTHAVDTFGETSSHLCLENALSVRGVIEALEKFERERIKWLCRVERWKRFDDNMRMADQDTVTVDLLWRGVVVGLGVDEIASDHVYHTHLDGKRSILDDRVVAVLWEDKLAARSLVKGDDAAHRRLVAGATSDLFAIGEGDALVEELETVVDEIVGRCFGTNLSGVWSIALSVLSQTLRDDGRVKRQ